MYCMHILYYLFETNIFEEVFLLRKIGMNKKERHRFLREEEEKM